MKPIAYLLVFVVLGLVMSAGGCAWVGRTAGKAQAKIERKANDLESGYHDGYKGEKAKSAGPVEKSSTPPAD